MRTRSRSPNDFYRTPPEATRILIHYLRDDKPIWEPCAGDGAIVDVLQSKGYECHGSDIAPQRQDIGQYDFFNPWHSQGLIVTNPPFCHAEEMIKHALGRNAEAWWLLRLQWIGTQRRQYLTKMGLKQVIVISDLIKFTTADGRIMNGNGTGQCAWFNFVPEYGGEASVRWEKFR